ncbi:hypothetical protein FH972_025899 [Carpinus fangiana]|uniref:Zn(2)-C6 fungal-type domain-containing protein n=1 Tax=Carpinus fangiana TaxID=176857 RepID=A0A5N6L2X1_9ROSI|nr:hypothetical protein FH972_025899 [Carpinus fangiana]
MPQRKHIVPRSRTGCLTCRDRRMKCDESAPICRNCSSSGRECRKGVRVRFRNHMLVDEHHLLSRQKPGHHVASTNRGLRSGPWQSTPEDGSIVADEGRPQLAPDVSGVDQLNAVAVRSIPTNDSHPDTSLNEISQAWSHRSVNGRVSVQDSSTPYSTGYPTPRTEIRVDNPQELTQKEIQLLKHYLNECAPWFDSTDPKFHFSMMTAHHMLRSSPWKLAAFALASRNRHMKKEDKDDRHSLELYQEAVHQVIDAISEGSADEGILAGCLLLAVYEMMAYKWEDWNRHVEGCGSMITSRCWNGSSEGLVGSCFWVYARIAFCKQTSTYIPTDAWFDDIVLAMERNDISECEHANLAVWLFAQVINARVRSSQPRRRPTMDESECARLCDAFERWYKMGSERSSPLTCTSPNPETDHPFPKVVCPSRGSELGYTMHHTGMVLLLEQKMIHGDETGETAAALHRHAMLACGIVQSNPHPPSLVNAIQPVYICAQHLKTKAEKFGALELLAMIERTTGWRYAPLSSTTLQATTMSVSLDSTDTNGTHDHTQYGVQTVEALKQVAQKPNGPMKSNDPKKEKDHELVLQTFRLLIADLCQQFGGGHAGTHRITRPGSTAIDLCFPMLKSYHSDRPDAMCPGHPEIEHEGIEVTTGPLGQGVANAVGLAMATKQLAATYNKPSFDVVNNHTWCMIGDACLQEGVALEALSLAGHLVLDNLTVIYDNNQITCDGSVDITNTEDVNAKMRACGWEVIDVEDGCFNIAGIINALEQSKSKESTKPTFINIRTIIGVGSAVAGNAVAHGLPFGADDVVQMKKLYGFNPEEHFIIPEKVRGFFEELPSRGKRFEAEWDSLIGRYTEAHPELAAELKRRVEGRLPSNWKELMPSKFPGDPTPTRKAAGLAFNPIAKDINNFMVGTADLTPSVNMSWKGQVAFQNVSGFNPQPPLDNANYQKAFSNYSMRNHWGLHRSYAAPAVRMGALQKLQAIHVATHDSIGTGEDGPTHQPIELAALYRAMPNILYMRPGDSEEVAGAWEVAIEAKTQPSIISLSRHALPQLQNTDRTKVSRGAYVLRENTDADITLIGTGSELSFAVEMADILAAQHGLQARVISFPCQRLFEQQDRKYKQSVLRRESGKPVVVVEAYAANGWERYADGSFSMHSFGHSLPGMAAYKHFGFVPANMAATVERWVKDNKGTFPNYEFTELMKY